MMTHVDKNHCHSWIQSVLLWMQFSVLSSFLKRKITINKSEEKLLGLKFTVFNRLNFQRALLYLNLEMVVCTNKNTVAPCQCDDAADWWWRSEHTGDLTDTQSSSFIHDQTATKCKWVFSNHVGVTGCFSVCVNEFLYMNLLFLTLWQHEVSACTTACLDLHNGSVSMDRREISKTSHSALSLLCWPWCNRRMQHKSVRAPNSPNIVS